MSGDRNPEPTCSRCGYDLRGAVATWDDAGCCPLDGTCTECGLTLAWSDLFATARGRPFWCVEFAFTNRLPVACAFTFARSFVPWRLWKSIRMEHAIEWRRIMMYAAIVAIVPAILLYAAVQTSVAVYVRYQTEAALTRLQILQAQQLASLQAEVTANLPADHGLNVMIQRIQLEMGNTTGVNFAYWQCVLEAVFLPRREFSQGTINGPAGPTPYHAPRSLYGEMYSHYFANLRRGTAVPAWLARGSPTDPFLMLLAGTSVLAIVPISLTLLPISRRRARVCWRHIVRVAAYSAALPTSIALLVLLLLLSAILAPAWSGRAHSLGTFIALGGLPIATFIWWWTAITNYLRMPRGGLIALSLTSISILIVVLGTWLVDKAVIVRWMS